MSDLQTAFRAMRGHPGFSTIVILTMAVGIAVNAAIFSVYDRLVLHPVTIPDPSSLVAIWFNNPQRNTQTPSSSVPRYDELRAEVPAFGVSPLNVSIYAGVAALFGIVAALACLGPSWRASRISPLVAFRSE